MEEQTALRIGLVGCGWHGRNLAEAMSRTEALRLVACADPDQKAASRAATVASEASTHTSVEALLAESEVDAIVIATPHHLLAPVAITALRGGKHVMAEKPIALNEREAMEIDEAMAQGGVCYMPGYSMRFSIGRQVHDLLAQGTVGEIRVINGAMGCGPLNEDWIAYPETGGGALLFLGSHLVDLILWLFADNPIDVFATVQYRVDTGADDISSFQMRFVKGGLAQCLITQAASTFFYQLDVYGSSGKISLRGRSFMHFEIEVSSNIVTAYREPTLIRPILWRDHISSMLVPELEEFASAIRERRTPLVTISDGRRVLRILDTVKESARCNEPILLRN